MPCSHRTTASQVPCPPAGAHLELRRLSAAVRAGTPSPGRSLLGFLARTSWGVPDGCGGTAKQRPSWQQAHELCFLGSCLKLLSRCPATCGGTAKRCPRSQLNQPRRRRSARCARPPPPNGPRALLGREPARGPLVLHSTPQRAPRGERSKPAQRIYNSSSTSHRYPGPESCGPPSFLRCLVADLDEEASPTSAVRQGLELPSQPREAPRACAGSRASRRSLTGRGPLI